jgi:hypothetical protein
VLLACAKALTKRRGLVKETPKVSTAVQIVGGLTEVLREDRPNDTVGRNTDAANNAGYSKSTSLGRLGHELGSWC